MTKVDDLAARMPASSSRSTRNAATRSRPRPLQENYECAPPSISESLASLERKTCQVIGSSPSNFDQRAEIDCGSLDSLRAGMPVVNDAGWLANHQRSPETSIVMLVTDPLYHAGEGDRRGRPDALDDRTGHGAERAGVEDVTTTTSTTTTTLPPSSTSVPRRRIGRARCSATRRRRRRPQPRRRSPRSRRARRACSTASGGDRLPRVSFIADSPLFGRAAEGDCRADRRWQRQPAPRTSRSVAANVIPGTGVEGLQLEVDLNADLDRLNFVTVILYTARERRRSSES
jgi:hypothetical protein